MTESKRCMGFTCRVCGEPEAARAIDNIPQHAHLCEGCYLLAVRVNPLLAFHYVEIK